MLFYFLKAEIEPRSPFPIKKGMASRFKSSKYFMFSFANHLVIPYKKIGKREKGLSKIN